MRKHKYSIVFTGARDGMPYDVIDSNRYGDVQARCRSRRIARLLIAALNQANLGTGEDAPT